MSETTNENLQEAKEVPIVGLPVKPIDDDGARQAPEEAPITDEGSPLEEPKVIGVKVIKIETTIYDNGQQNISVNTPDNSSIAENLGMLSIAKHILLKDKF